MKLKPFACITINIVLYFNTFYDYLYNYCKRLLQMQILNMLKTNAAAWRPRRLHSAHLGDLHIFRTLWERCKDSTLV